MRASERARPVCVHVQTCGVSKQRCGDTLEMKREHDETGMGELGSPQNISQGKPLLFCSVGAAEEEMPLAAQSCMPPSNYLQPYREELDEQEIGKRYAAIKSGRINTLV